MSIDLYYTSSAAPVFFFVPQFYTLSPDTSGEMLVRTKKGAALYQSDAGIETVEILLSRPIKYPDGTVIPSGETVDALRVAPELQGLGDVENEKAVVYRYGLTVSDPTAGSWHISGLLTVNPDTGKIKPACGPAAVCVGQIVVAASVCGVQVPSPSISAGGYAELEFSGADLAAGQLLLFHPPTGKYILDIDLDITTPFNCNFSLGTLENPVAYANLIPADRNYTVPIRNVSQGQAIYLTTDVIPPTVDGIGRAVITLM